jgi:hypothetical protein
MKCVMIIDESLPLGLIANTAAVLGVSIGAYAREMVGEDVFDGERCVHPGITQLSIPLLQGCSASIAELRRKVQELADPALYSVDFCDVAQKSKHYEHYRSRLAETRGDELQYLGMALYGPDAQVKALTGQMALLR